MEISVKDCELFARMGFTKIKTEDVQEFAPPTCTRPFDNPIEFSGDNAEIGHDCDSCKLYCFVFNGEYNLNLEC